MVVPSQTRTTLDADASKVLEATANVPRMETLTPPAAREASRAATRPLLPALALTLEIRDFAAEDGAPAMRLYRPLSDRDRSRPCLVWFHGGGWVVGDIDSRANLCAELAAKCDICVLAVSYRLAPEDPFPAAVDDCLNAIEWFDAHAERLGIDISRTAIGGDSAGANLAAVTCLHLRNAGRRRPTMQLLIYPITDLSSEHASYEGLPANLLLTANLMRWFRLHYLADPRQAEDWRASPLLAESMADLPPAYVLTVGYDPLCDEGIALVKRLRADGVRVEHRHLSDQIHGFLTMGHLIERAQDVIAELCGVLNSAVGNPSKKLEN